MHVICWLVWEDVKSITIKQWSQGSDEDKQSEAPFWQNRVTVRREQFGSRKQLYIDTVWSYTDTRSLCLLELGQLLDGRIVAVPRRIYRLWPFLAQKDFTSVTHAQLVCWLDYYNAL